MSIRSRISLPVIAVLSLTAAGCGTGSDLSTSSTLATAPQPPGGVLRIVMKSLEFSPLAVEARVGQRVVWTNLDRAPHNVTYVTGPTFLSSRRLGFGQRFSIKLTQPGTIHYVCTIHPWMKATIVVSP